MRRKLLIVEDERAEREGLETFIDWTGLGIEVLPSACDGEEGLARIRVERPAIVITDIRMPVMSGLEMIEKCRAEEGAASHTPEFIVSSGHDEFDYARQALRMGVMEYLLKPVEREPLETVLGLCLERVARRERETLSWISLAPEVGSAYRAVDGALGELTASVLSLDPDRVDAGLDRVRAAMRSPHVRRDAVLDSLVDRWLSNTLQLTRRSLSRDGDARGGAAPEGLRRCDTLDALCDAIVSRSRALVETLRQQAGERKADVVRMAVDAILRDYALPLSLKSVAYRIGVSPNYLGKVFTKVEGKGFSEYLTDVRMARAERLLAEGRLKVKAVAEAVGCPNVPYFCTLFKSVYGVSPSRYFDRES